jgi:hypothetical protein
VADRLFLVGLFDRKGSSMISFLLAVLLSVLSHGGHVHHPYHPADTGGFGPMSSGSIQPADTGGFGPM